MRISFNTFSISTFDLNEISSPYKLFPAVINIFKQMVFQVNNRLTGKFVWLSATGGVMALTLYLFLRSKGKVNTVSEFQPTVEKSQAVAPIASLPPRQPDISATIHLVQREEIGSRFFTSWPLYGDQTFAFGKTLRRLDGSRYEIKPTDRYLEFMGSGDQVKPGEEYFQLPSVLFENVTEGQTIQFFNDRHLFSLSCSQCAATGEPFEEALRAALENPALNALYPEDIKEIPSLGEIPILEAKPLLKTAPFDFEKIRKDQEQYGRYKSLQVHELISPDAATLEKGKQCMNAMVLVQDSSTHEIQCYLPKNVTQDEIAFYAIKNHSGEFFLLFVPHRPELNQIEEAPNWNPPQLAWVAGAFVALDTDLPGILQIKAKEFNPQFGHRIYGYNHGWYDFFPTDGKEFPNIKFIAR